MRCVILLVVSGAMASGAHAGLVGSYTVGSGSNSSHLQFDFGNSNTYLYDVRYDGVLPDLFREGQGVVAMGTRGTDGVFQAREVLAKHDEKYMPPEVVDALKRSGHWEEGQTGQGGNL